ncbi:SMC-Scp complex subunit ScpB [Ferviditalea candida]|uniref:Segregation and condensation protein B n=1 Tax=Ferviditalea candida TaxID=3108399 RepID=A0ABU5ZJT5_9BACL|nr:SMC-Scp complex subunit ScpB [Paenibacillaceae bacterium T2]
MDDWEVKSVIEGLLFVSGDEGIDAKQIAEVLGQDVDWVIDVLHDMKGDFSRQKRGIQILEIAGSFQLTTLPAHASYFERLAASPSHGTLSQAALETLAIVAYRQPITRVEIEDIRGVKSDRAIHTLVAKELIQEVGRAEAIGKPILYGTTKSFLDYFALNSVGDLPDISAFESNENLEEETRLLFQKLEERQITIDDLT